MFAELGCEEVESVQSSTSRAEKRSVQSRWGLIPHHTVRLAAPRLAQGTGLDLTP